MTDSVPLTYPYLSLLPNPNCPHHRKIRQGIVNIKKYNNQRISDLILFTNNCTIGKFSLENVSSRMVCAICIDKGALPTQS